MPLKMGTQHLESGRNAESVAERYLIDQGLKSVAKNYQCPFGEIDLIMQDKDYLVFVEVRKRTNPDFGTAIESVTPSKIKKIIRSAMHYLRKRNLLYTAPCRFDIIGIHPVGGKTTLEWVQNAFSL